MTRNDSTLSPELACLPVGRSRGYNLTLLKVLEWTQNNPYETTYIILTFPAFYQ